MAKIQIIAERPRIVINGINHHLGWKATKIAEVLYKAKGEMVGYDHLENVVFATKQTIATLVSAKLTPIFKDQGYFIMAEKGEGYRLVQAVKE